MRRAARAQWWLLLGLLLCLPFAQARDQQSHDAAATPAILAADLPPEARSTLQLIRQNGPFPYSRDGSVFNNYERVLPQQPHGHYHEYTVRTPSVRNRGARRIVCGPVTECYYTADHYRTFRRIREENQ